MMFAVLFDLDVLRVSEQWMKSKIKLRLYFLSAA